MILQEKDYTKKELAEWFNISASTLYKKKEHYLELLKGYADFKELKNKKIRIIKVYIDTYEKATSKSRQIIHDYYYDGWPGLKPNTIKGATALIIEKHKEEIEGKEETTYKYVLNETNIRFGKIKDECGGTDGYRQKGWCTIDKETGEIRFLNAEERQLYYNLKEQYYSPFEEQELLAYQSFLQGECSKEDVEYSIHKKQNAFMTVKRKWKSITGQDFFVGTQLCLNEKDV